MFKKATNYFFVFNDYQADLLLTLIEEYVNGAELQISRIERTRKLIGKSIKNVEYITRTAYRSHHLKLFCDAHYYFICIGQVNNCLKGLCKKLKNKELHKIYSAFQKTFKNEIRNDLEHIADRAVGLKKKGRKSVSIGNIQDFKNFSNEDLTFNGKKYPVNRKALNKLKGIYKDIIKRIHKDYALKDTAFVTMMQQDKLHKRLTRIAMKEYQQYLHSKQA